MKNRFRLIAFGLASLGFLAAPISFAAAAAPAADVVRVKTSLGSFDVRLDAKRAPVTVRNFLNYVDKGFYNNTIFHRVIDGFMIQGGGFTADMKQKRTDDKIINEARTTESNRRGTIAMARTSEPHSATSQFFINTTNNDFLDAKKSRDGWGYAVFGRVIRGMDVVDKISIVKTTTKGFYENVPVTPVVIESIQLLENKKVK